MKFNFDGKGINDKENVYAERVATLTEHGHAIGAGPVLAASADMLEALRFYADPESWKEVETGIGMYPGDASEDNGSRAREILERYKL